MKSSPPQTYRNNVSSVHCFSPNKRVHIRLQRHKNIKSEFVYRRKTRRNERRPINQTCMNCKRTDIFTETSIKHLCRESCLTMSEAMIGYKAMAGKRRDSGVPLPGPARKHSFGGSLSNRPWNKCADNHYYIIQEIEFTYKLELDPPAPCFLLSSPDFIPLSHKIFEILMPRLYYIIISVIRPSAGAHQYQNNRRKLK